MNPLESLKALKPRHYQPCSRCALIAQDEAFDIYLCTVDAKPFITIRGKNEWGVTVASSDQHPSLNIYQAGAVTSGWFTAETLGFITRDGFNDDGSVAFIPTDLFVKLRKELHRLSASWGVGGFRLYNFLTPDPNKPKT